MKERGAEPRALAAARARLDQAPEGPARALAVVQLSRCLLEAGRAAEAAASAAAAADLLGRLDLPVAAGRAQRLQSDALLADERPDEALGRAVEAATTFAAAQEGGAEPAPTPADLAGCDAARAAALRALGRLPESEQYLRSARTAYGEAGMTGRESVAGIDLAAVLHAQGRTPEAVDLLEAARAHLLRSRRADDAAACAFDLGVAHHDAGNYDDAVECLLQARSIFESLRRLDDVAACNQNLGVAFHAMGRHAEAHQRLMVARRAYAHLGRDRDASQCDHDLAVVLRALGDDEAAAELEHRVAGASA